MRFVVYSIVFLLGGLAALTFDSSLFSRKVSLRPTIQVAQVTKVIDGDTIELEGGRRVRYAGIDTPEMGDGTTTVICFAQEAKEENVRIVEGKTVRLTKDVSETDKYGRLLRYVYVGDVFINDYLVRQGFARMDTIPPDVRYQNQFLDAEREARREGRGLWGRCRLGFQHAQFDRV